MKLATFCVLVFGCTGLYAVRSFVPVQRAYFSPHIRNVLASMIEQERKSIHVAAYTMTDPTVARSLVAAARRGVNVNIIVDPYTAAASNSKIKNLLALYNVHLYQFVSDHPQGSIMHHKFLLFGHNDFYDVTKHNKHKCLTMTGSCNVTTAAYSRNCENMLVINDVNIFESYLQEFRSVKQSCVRLSKVGK
ncbi:DUF1669 domain-containing protein [Candidatus Babeliales bacterium]|nr:DUF1669 domain-containing protein [Candidatus Babeliales bacterium]